MLVGDGGEKINKAKNSRRTIWSWNAGPNCAWGAANCGSASRPKSGAVSWAALMLESHKLALTFTDHTKRRWTSSVDVFKMEHMLDPRGCSLFYGVLEAVQAYVIRHWRGAWRQYIHSVAAAGQPWSQEAFLTDEFLLLKKDSRDLLRTVLSKVKTGTASQQGQKKTNSGKHITSPRDNLEELRLAFENEDKHWATSSGKKDPAMSFSLAVLAQIYEQYFGEVPSTKAGAKMAPRRERLEKIFFPDGKEIKSVYTQDQRNSLQPVFERLFSSGNDALGGDAEMSHELLDPRHLDAIEAAPAARTRAGPIGGVKRCLFFRLQQQVRRSAKAAPSFDTFAADHYEDYATVSYVTHRSTLPLFSIQASQWLKVSPGLELASRPYAITALDVLAFPVSEVAPSPSTTNSADAVGHHLPPAGDYLLIYAIQQRAVGDATTYVWRGRSAKEVQEQSLEMKTEKLRDLPMDDYHCEVFNFGHTQVKPCPPLSTNVGTLGAASSSCRPGLRTAFEFLPERLLHLLNLSQERRPSDNQRATRQRLFDSARGRGVYRVRTFCQDPPSFAQDPQEAKVWTEKRHDVRWLKLSNKVEEKACLERLDGDVVTEDNAFWMPWENFVALGRGLPPGVNEHHVYTAPLPSRQYVQESGALVVRPALGVDRKTGSFVTKRPRSASATSGGAPWNPAEQAEVVPAAGPGETTVGAGGGGGADEGAPSSGGTTGGAPRNLAEQAEVVPAACPGETTGTAGGGSRGESQADAGSGSAQTEIVLAVLASVIAFVVLLLICLRKCLIRSDAAADEQWTPKNPGGEQAYGGPYEQWTLNPAGEQAYGGEQEYGNPGGNYVAKPKRKRTDQKKSKTKKKNKKKKEKKST
ncbi:unnamed protein product [Amoebophrya sp. A25]|nr:unnamed protein product [Amoebophrya sp. A25]|eukprot:GSA25T00004579001.1